MATTNITIDFPERQASKSSWSVFKSWLLESILNLGCCGEESLRDYECYRTGEQVRECVRAEMREHLGYGGRDTCVGGAIDSVLRETGYDLVDGTYANMDKIRQANEGVTRTMAEWDAYFESMGVNPLNVDQKDVFNVRGRAKIVPRFAAACAIHLRAKLGALSRTEANILLVQRKYLEVCRRHGVRDVDTVLHQGFVMNAVFTESVLDDIAASRRRLPAWIRFLEEVPKTGSIPQDVC
nr:tombus P33-like protein [Tolivirales sp.]